MRKNTLFGILAILFWSTNVAFSRSLAEEMGFLTSGASMYVIGGVAAILFAKLKQGNKPGLSGISKKYLFVCGTLFVINTIVFQIAVGLAVTRDQILIIGLINYLWTVLSLIFTVILLKKKSKPILLAAGICLAVIGIWLASTQGQALEFLQPGQLPRSLLVYGLALLAAVTWGLYSSLARVWAAEGHNDGAVPYFLVIAGLIMGTARLFIAEPTHVNASTLIQLLYMVIFPTALAYIFWDIGMRKGNIILVVSLSYFIPLLSTVWSAFFLQIPLTAGMGLAVIMVVVAAYLSNLAVMDRDRRNLPLAEPSTTGSDIDTDS